MNQAAYTKLPERVYVIMFMGQSNMAGRGLASQAPAVVPGTAYEFKSVSSPDALFPLQEPFGELENNPSGVYEPGMKTGSMVSAFANAFYDRVHVPIVGISCAKGGSSIAEWIPGTPYYCDAAARNRACVHWLSSHQIKIVKNTLVWCQGCTDGDLRTEPWRYKKNTDVFLHTYMSDCGMDIGFLIQIGNHRDDPALYAPIQQAQEELAREHSDIVLVSQIMKTLAQKGLMKDQFHYLQTGYDIVGTDAGRNTAEYIISHT